jgi:hypothetical protein
MAINAVVISGSDPGAVPGASTILFRAWRPAPRRGVAKRKEKLWGRTRIDERVKDLAFARHDTTVIGSYRVVANDNYAEVALAA